MKIYSNICKVLSTEFIKNKCHILFNRLYDDKLVFNVLHFLLSYIFMLFLYYNFFTSSTPLIEDTWEIIVCNSSNECTSKFIVQLTMQSVVVVFKELIER